MSHHQISCLNGGKIDVVPRTGHLRPNSGLDAGPAGDGMLLANNGAPDGRLTACFFRSIEPRDAVCYEYVREARRHRLDTARQDMANEEKRLLLPVSMLIVACMIY